MKVVSVPHTGTMFLYELLLAHFQVTKTHTTEKALMEILERKRPTICVPMRHPSKSWRTWRIRGTGFYDDFVSAWATLDRVYHKFDPLFLPVDTDDRDDYLDRMSISLGVKLETDWSPKNTTQSDVRVRDVDLAKVMELDVVRKFYA